MKSLSEETNDEPRNMIKKQIELQSKPSEMIKALKDELETLEKGAVMTID